MALVRARTRRSLRQLLSSRTLNSKSRLARIKSPATDTFKERQGERGSVKDAHLLLTDGWLRIY